MRTCDMQLCNLFYLNCVITPHTSQEILIYFYFAVNYFLPAPMHVICNLNQKETGVMHCNQVVKKWMP